MGEMNLLFTDAQEESVAQTRAFSTLYVAAAALGLIISGDDEGLAQMNRLPGAAQRLLTTFSALATVRL
jgi:glucosamine--fructose-6-phosphate aminotransferase (isomerizing)